MKLLSFFLAALAGSAMALQGAFNTAAGKVIGDAENTLLVHVIGAAVVAVLLLLGVGRGDFTKYAEIPWYGWLGGVLSAVIIFGVIFAMGHLGVAGATAVIILFQISMAFLIDSFGLFNAERVPFAWTRLLGIALLIAGTRLVTR